MPIIFLKTKHSFSHPRVYPIVRTFTGSPDKFATWIRYQTFVKSHFGAHFWAEFSLFRPKKWFIKVASSNLKNLKNLRSQFYILYLINRFLYPLHITLYWNNLSNDIIKLRFLNQRTPDRPDSFFYSPTKWESWKVPTRVLFLKSKMCPILGQIMND